MRNFYLIGKNIENSLSPLIHNYVFEKLNLNANYQLMEIADSAKIYQLLKNYKKNNIHGLNITNPYKMSVFPYMHKVTDECNQINAVNCIEFKDQCILGHNTDWFGFFKMLQFNNIDLLDKKIKVIGLGGAHHAVIYAISLMGCSEIELYDRGNVQYILDNDFKSEYVVINCSPNHFINDESQFIDYFISRKNIWIDLLYTKLSTKNQNLINLNHQKLYIDGLDMLIYQALASINIWFSKNIFKNVDLYDLKSTLKRD